MTKVKLIETDGVIGFNHEGIFITDVTVSDCGRFSYDKNEAMYQYSLTEEQYDLLFLQHDMMVLKSKEPSLQDALEDITGQMEMGKIDDSQALEIMSNIVFSFIVDGELVAGHKKEQS